MRFAAIIAIVGVSLAAMPISVLGAEDADMQVGEGLRGLGAPATGAAPAPDAEDVRPAGGVLGASAQAAGASNEEEGASAAEGVAEGVSSGAAAVSAGDGTAAGGVGEGVRRVPESLRQRDR
jgi:hypothetical protein